LYRTLRGDYFFVIGAPPCGNWILEKEKKTLGGVSIGIEAPRCTGTVASGRGRGRRWTPGNRAGGIGRCLTKRVINRQPGQPTAARKQRAGEKTESRQGLALPQATASRANLDNSVRIEDDGWEGEGDAQSPAGLICFLGEKICFGARTKASGPIQLADLCFRVRIDSAGCLVLVQTGLSACGGCSSGDWLAINELVSGFCCFFFDELFLKFDRRMRSFFSLFFAPGGGRFRARCLVGYSCALKGNPP